MAEALRLLGDAGLPTGDLPQIRALRLWVLEGGGSVLGVIALERFGTHALLRSLAIAPEFRGRGFGRDLVRRLEHDAREDGVERLTLLTETATAFFGRLGYAAIDRGEVPDEVRGSAEFRSLCPVTAVCMAKSL
jgi:amino-acid N-acetyltransferase